MYKQAGFARAACIAMVMALAAFSYAIATAGRGIEVAPAAGRAISSNLNFANPFVDPTLASTLDRDIGDAVIGSAVLRHITALGGVKPYTFTTTTLASNTSLGLDSDGLFHTVPVTTVGTVTTYGPLTGTPGLFRFNVTVKDSFGSQGHSKTEPYRLNILANTVNAFRFAISGLSDGQQYREYVDNIAVINGKAPFKYTATGITLAGKAVSTLESIGLTIGSDGTVFGVPLQSGLLTFTANVTDATGAKALARSGTGVGQTISLTINANVTLNNTVVCTALTASGDTTTGGKDKLSISGLFNPGIFSKLTGNVTVQVNGYTISGAIGAKGKVTGLSLQALATAKVPALTGTISPKGTFKFTVSNESFGRNNLIAVSPVTGLQLNTMVHVTIGNSVDGMNSISAFNKGKGTKFSFSYKLGTFNKTGVINPTLGGAFILTSVSGKDDTKGGTGDSWKVALVAVPPGGGAAPVVFAGATSASVSIGNSFTDTEAVTSNKGVVKTGKLDTKTNNKLTKLQLSEKGKGSYQTSFIASSQTGIPLGTAGSSAGVNYTTNVTLLNGSTAFYGGDGALTIFPKSKGWSSQQK
jgi:hypothetical protein